MAFYGDSFIFNGAASDDFELMIYDMNSAAQSEGKFASTVSIIEERVASRWRPVFYGTKMEGKLEFDLVFGVNQERLDEGRYLDRDELDAVASWLTGLDGYRWLSIVQEDMLYARYRCCITGLEIVEYGRIPWALKASITCDGPYAYMSPHEYRYAIDGDSTIALLNESSYNGYYYPVIEFERTGGDRLAIENTSDNGRIFEIKNIPQAATSIRINNENGVITDNAELNLYDGFNFNFFRLKRGYNALKVSGKGILKIICEFPINVGG